MADERGLSARARAWIALAALLGLAVIAFGGCGSSDGGSDLSSSGGNMPGSATSCRVGQQGCACSPEGATVACGRVDRQNGNYVTCSMGNAVCRGGQWGACIGDHIVTRSLPQLTLTTTGLHTLSPSFPPCTNLCDPNGCLSTQANPADVDAAGFVLGLEGGLTLVEASLDAAPADGGCSGLQCMIANCGGGVTTTLSGTVYDPAGKNPLYDANVYIPSKPTNALPAFGTGASCDTCGGAGSLNALQATQTDATGHFTLTNVPTVSNLPVVVQMGKWRREILLTSITSCQTNSVTANCTAPNPADCVFRLPRNQHDGYDPVARTYTKADLPQIAISSGNADPFDCLLLKAGIDPNEVGDYTSTKRIHFYQGNGDTLDPAYGINVPGSTLWNNLNGAAPNMMSYDVILLPCEGGAYDKQGASANTPYQNLITYTNLGGRAFTTHFSYHWLEYPSAKNYVAGPDNWAPVANWAPTGASMTSTVDTQDPLTGIVNAGFPKGSAYSQWLQNVAASNAPSSLTIHEGRQDLTTIGANVQSWMTAHDTVYAPAPDYTNLFTFNTPLAAASAQQCGRVVYSDFHVSASALVGANQCLSDADCGFTATCMGATQGAVGQCSEPCGTSADCPNSSFTCSGAASGTCGQKACTTNAQCGTGRSCVSGTCTCTGNADCNGGACASMTCSPISCTSTAQCGNGTCQGGTCNSIACHKNADCGNGACGGAGRVGGCSATPFCHNNADCPSGGACGTGTGSTAGTCNTSGKACSQNSQCESGSCNATCTTSAATCHKNGDCDSSSCGTGTGSSAGTCNYGTAHVCTKNADCDSGKCGGGTCAIGGATACHKNGDCDSNSCGTGTGATAGKCATSATACTQNSQCESGSCKGACGTSAQVCHKNTDCESDLCGTGAGSTAGTCGPSACHKNSDCESNSCGTGSGSAAGACQLAGVTNYVCHQNSDCDSGSCGSGTGAALGTCNTGVATVCTLANQATVCDSGVCTGIVGGSGHCSTKNCAGDSVCGISHLCNSAKCSTASCHVDTDCSSINAGTVCSNAKCSTVSCHLDEDCAVTKTCTGAKCATEQCSTNADCSMSNTCSGLACTTATCHVDGDCSISGACNGAKCSTATCAQNSDCTASNTCGAAHCTSATCHGDTDCGVSNLCNNARCSTATCGQNGDCSVSGACNGKCTNATCHADTDCGISNLCNNAKCSVPCNADTDCANGAVCNGATCTPPPSCGVNSDCGANGGRCSNTKCSASACATNGDCGAGSVCGGSCQPSVCTQNSDCASGICNGGTCGCVSGEACGAAQTCNGATPGACQKACTQDADCAPDRCVNGQCGGCTNSSECHDNAFSTSCNGIPAGNYGACSIYNKGEFPETCRQGDLSAQEKALEFMFFDLTSCVSPDNAPPPPPPTTIVGYKPATFVEDFTASCPAATVPAWREFDWQAQIPSGASISFSAQTGKDAGSLGPATPVSLANVTTSTNTGPTMQNFDVAFIDTGKTGTGAFNIAVPPVVSAALLRITIALDPTTDMLQAPTLLQWKVQYDCVASE